MNTLLSRLKVAFKDPAIRNRILFIIGALLVYRALAAIPIPGIDVFRLEQFFASNQLLGLLNIFSGGGLSSLSIMMLGVAPYITAAIIMQLMTVMFPKIKEMYHNEGQAGRRKFTQISRLLTVPLAAIQGFSFLLLLEQQGVIGGLTPFGLGVNIIIITAGSVLIMWVGELISEFGIGNGVSILIFAGIIAALPSAVSQLLFTFEPSQIPMYLAVVAVAIVITYLVVLVNEAERPVPTTYAKQSRGSAGGVSSFIPLKVNQAGVMPIIFALSILLFPQMLINLFAGSGAGWIQQASLGLQNFFNNLLLYGAVYFVLVILFTFFYSAITFDTEAMADNLQKNGAFIPGVRPGTTTSEYIGRIMSRITFVGAIFLGFIAVLPIAMQAITGIQTLAIGGTALLIVVAVVIDVFKRVDAQVAMREY